MKRLIAVAVVFMFSCWLSGMAVADDVESIHILKTATIKFDTSAGTTTFASAIDLAGAKCLAVIPVGDEIWCTFGSGATTPVKDKHIPLEVNVWTFLLPDEAANGVFTGGGTASGWVNLVTYDKWANPY